MTKYLFAILTLATTLPSAHAAGFDTEALATVAHAKPLIKAFLAEQGREYGVELAPDEASYRARVNYAWFVNWPAYAIVGGTKYDYACRPVDVRIPSQNAKARFYVRHTYASGPFPIVRRYRQERYDLVRGCGVGNLSLPPELRLFPRPMRIFEDAEVIGAAREIVAKIDADATDYQIEPSARFRTWNRADVYADPADEPDEVCRHVSFTRPGQSTRTKIGVVAIYDRTRPVAYLPAHHQTVVRDAKSVRPFVFALSRGCYGMSVRAPAEMPGDL